MNQAIRNVFVWLLLISSTGFIFSNAHAQSPIVLLSDTSYLIGKSMLILEDVGDSLTIEDVQRPEIDAQFELYDKESPNFGNVQMTTWNKVILVNQTNQDWLLLINNYSLDTIEYYSKDEYGVYQKERSGRSIPQKERKINTGVYIYDAPVEKGDTAVFYFKIKCYFMQYPTMIISKLNYMETYHVRDRIEGFYYGFIFLLIFYYLIVYISIREKSYLYYILYVISTAVLTANLKGTIHDFWDLFGEGMHFVWQYEPAVIAITSSVTFIFTQHILETKKTAPKLHKVLVYLFIPWYGINVIMSFLGYNHFTSVSNQLTGVLALFVLYFTGVVVYRRGYRYARFYIAACWSFFLGVLVYVLQSFQVIPYSVYSNNAVEIGSTIQVIMFAFTMADKMNTFKKEKAAAQENLLASLQENEKLITNQNVMLTTKVEERTSELKQTLSNLEVAQSELQQKNALITHEKERSDELLLNILPEEVANELKDNGTSAAQHFENVSVLFTDFEGFTALASSLSPQELVAEINEYFSEFDQIMERNHVEKIKTIGDAYMAVGGLPISNRTHAHNVVQAAFEIQDFMERKAAEKKEKKQLYFSCRIGIHSGPVVAGIVGVKKFQYDVWGDTVNTASRYESNGVAARINISATTKNLLGDQYHYEHRGKIAAKGKGEMDMYFVNRKI